MIPKMGATPGEGMSTVELPEVLNHPLVLLRGADALRQNRLPIDLGLQPTQVQRGSILARVHADKQIYSRTRTVMSKSGLTDRSGPEETTEFNIKQIMKRRK